jgi:hypothetical protein
MNLKDKDLQLAYSSKDGGTWKATKNMIRTALLGSMNSAKNDRLSQRHNDKNKTSVK